MNTQPIKLCARTDIPEGEMIEMSVPGTDNSLLLVSTKGAIRAFQNKCPHMDRNNILEISLDRQSLNFFFIVPLSEVF